MKKPKEEINERVQEAARILQIEEYLKRKPKQLSGGQRQTLAVARAEHLGAKLLILDEPTSALGVKQASVVLKYINNAKKRGIGIIFITHNVTHALAIGDRFAILKHGKLDSIYLKTEINESKLIHLMSGGDELEKLKKEIV